MGSGNLLTLRAPNMATGGCDFAFLPAAGKMLSAVEFKTVFDAEIHKELKTGTPATPNPLRVCFFLTYGAPHDSYSGSHTALPEDGVDGWVLDSNNSIETIQEYRRWFHPATGRVIIEFCFTSPFDVTEKADPGNVLLGGVQCTFTRVPYEAIGIELLFRSSHNERIEVWQERPEPYVRNDGSPCAIARLSVVFKWAYLPVTV